MVDSYVETYAERDRQLTYICFLAPLTRRVGHGTGLSDFTFTLHFHALEKEMASHSSVLAWRIPGTGEPSGGCRLWGRTESDTTEATKQQQQHEGLGGASGEEPAC